MADSDDVCVLVPTYNEAETIGAVVTGFVDQGYEHVLVVDGGSADDTQAVAREAGARVVEQSGTGKGQAVREALQRHVDRPYVLMLDGDSTYRPEEAERLLDPLLSGEAEHVIGNRFANMQSGAMTRLNQVGNRIINRSFSLIHGRNLVDILSGYRAFTLESANRLHLRSDGFGIETEMSVECVKHNVRTAVVPITYEPRPEDSETNLRPFRDGANIILTLYQMAKTNNPLFYFGSVGTLSTLTGIGLAAYVAYEWFVRSISHEVIAFLAGSAVLLGVQLLMFAVLSDMIVAVNREQTHQIQQIARKIGDEKGEDAGRVGEDAAGQSADVEESTVDESGVDPAES